MMNWVLHKLHWVFEREQGENDDARQLSISHVRFRLWETPWLGGRRSWNPLDATVRFV